ncbi:hypothetical protein CEXT_645851 [Caerostris extrusa]|uniref:Uncharacterized protein n=1 Tax=Caerostris extrusa TaxID=172846 RepID=A0AAV4MEM7_CAEEX|nr:hypothetical protein CEXT_645851 [Caerostris extrusa]
MWTYPLGRMHTLLIKSERTKTHSTPLTAQPRALRSHGKARSGLEEGNSTLIAPAGLPQRPLVAKRIGAFLGQHPLVLMS